MAPTLSPKNSKKFINKNKSIKIYREKKKKTDLYRQQVEELTQQYDKIDVSTIQKFKDLPLTDRTQRALKWCKYVTPTDIQKEAIGLALKGNDILGAARTGSGKTLAFVIPILEHLFCAGWSILDGLGAVIITPTRELAYQIFEVFNKVGANHQFSVALVIGGKDLAKEKKLLDKCNVVICTPGRLLQHMDENPLFDAMNMKILVLDEADRMLDLGFEQVLDGILDNLPQERQTLLFSATQTTSVKRLAKLSLKNPIYVSVHEHAKYSTPENLHQSYLVCEAQTKMNFLWSFLKSHQKQKILVFMASCKQVKYTHDMFLKLRSGMNIIALYGSLHQLKRMEIYDNFCQKQHAVLLATDIASRGLDFPNVNWVIQLDCPEDVNTYIHRAGRTARYLQGGESLLILLPSEEDSMVKQLKSKKIPIGEIKVNSDRLFSVQKKMEALCARDVNLKECAQRACKSYLKSIFLMKDKTVFDVTKIHTEEYAKSFGLAFAPRFRFIAKHLKKPTKDTLCLENSDFSNKEKVTKGGGSEDEDALTSVFGVNSGDESDEDLLKPKGSVQFRCSDSEEETKNPDDEDEILKKSKKPLTKAALAKRIIKKKIKSNTIIKYDDNGQPIQDISKQLAPVAHELEKEILERGYSIENAKLIMEQEDEIDKQLYKTKIKEKHRLERIKQRELNRLQNPGSAPSQLEDPKDKGSDSDFGPNNMSNSESEGSDEEESAISLDEEESAISLDEEESTKFPDEHPQKGKKRKKMTKDSEQRKCKKLNSDVNKLSVEDAEGYALELLT